MPDDLETLSLVVNGDRYTTARSGSITVGRSAEADVVLEDLRVSRRHLDVRFDPDRGWLLVDLGSRSGTYVDGEAVSEITIEGEVEVRLGDPRSGPLVAIAAPVPEAPDTREGSTADRDAAAGREPPGALEPAGRPATVPAPVDDRITIGRSADNDVTLPDLLVSRHHAIVTRGVDGTWTVEDLGSANGTFVGGQTIDRAELADGSIFSIARHALQLRGGRILTEPGSDVPALQCEQVAVTLPKGPRILDRVSFRASAGSLIAVLGPTGAGKSTLLKVLTGAMQPTEGCVLIEGRELHAAPDAIRPMLGYVPQDDILHPQLTIRRALTFGGELRLPPEVSPAEIARRVDDVMEELGLTHRADVPISHLSGGQRKRTSVALELLTAPKVLFLDEPTSGLDPGYEKSVMTLLRQLADAGRTVVVVTHSVQSLELCDEVLLLATGGHLAYLGAPEEVLPSLGHDEYADVFQELERWTRPVHPGPATPAQRLAASAEHRGAPDLRDPRDRARWLAQLRTLVRRQVAVITADRRVLLFFLAAVLVPAFLVLLVVDVGSLDHQGERPSTSARTLLGALVVSAVAIGAANTLREIVKERAVLAREQAAGLASSAYVTSKVVVFGAITSVQALLLVAIALSTAGGPAGSAFGLTGRLEIAIAVVLAALGAATLGLLLSSLVSSSEKAMALISIVFVVQWLLSGVALDLNETPVVQQVGYLTSANWGMAASASAADLAYLERNCEHAPDPPAGDPGVEPETATDPASSTSPGSPAAPDHEVDERSCDQRWPRGPFRWLGSVLAMAALVAAPLPVVHRKLTRQPT